jgi:hypothetical protein
LPCRPQLPPTYFFWPQSKSRKYDAVLRWKCKFVESESKWRWSTQYNTRMPNFLFVLLL